MRLPLGARLQRSLMHQGQPSTADFPILDTVASFLFTSINTYRMGQCCSSKKSAEWDIEETSDYQGKVHIINSKDEWEAKLSEATHGENIVIVAFTASWCGPCKLIGPHFIELSDKYPQMLFLNVDVDQLPELSEEWDIRAMPTFIFLKNGKEIDKLIGTNKPELLKRITNYAAACPRYRRGER